MVYSNIPVPNLQAHVSLLFCLLSLSHHEFPQPNYCSIMVHAVETDFSDSIWQFFQLLANRD